MSENESIGRRNIGAISSTANVEPTAVQKALRRTMLMKKLNTSRCTSPKELAERFQLLFETCLNNGFCPPVEALSLCSGIPHSTLVDMELARFEGYVEYSPIIKEAKQFISSIEAQLARDGEINSTVYIFRSKNFYGMTDKQEVVVTPNTASSVPMNEDEILANIPQLEEKN